MQSFTYANIMICSLLLQLLDDDDDDDGDAIDAIDADIIMLMLLCFSFSCFFRQTKCETHQRKLAHLMRMACETLLPQRILQGISAILKIIQIEEV